MIIKHLPSLALVCVLLPLPCHGLVKVYSTIGNVSEKQGNTWVRLSKGAELDGTHTIRINAASQLRVVDDADRRIYTFNEEGIHIFSDLINKAKKENNSLADRILAETARQSAAGSKKTHDRIGAAFRATMSEEMLEAFFSALSRGLGGASNDSLVKASLEAGDEDGIFTACFSNDSDDDMFVNLFAKSDITTWQSVFASSILIPAHSKLSLNHLPFTINASDMLTMVAFAEDFDAAEFDEMFAEALEPEAEPATNVTFFRVK